MLRNATTALYAGLRDILQSGAVITVREQEIREVTGRLTVIERPLERVIVALGRRNNIFGTIAETIWVLGGRNDIAFLQLYLPRAEQFSDDGLVWRAGYGPRLRHWDGTDQVREIVRLLREDRQSRRAVMVLFDPARDFVESKDIPCNNWLHFLIRENHLAMHAAIRSNDLIWGFSGTNTFEWSVLQEMLAFWTNSKVGPFRYFAGSFHLYAHHYKQAERILFSARRRTLYDFGVHPIPFTTELESFDERLERWFQLESRIRAGESGVLPAILCFTDPFMGACLLMLLIYRRHEDRAPASELGDLLQALPASDFRVAAIEYLNRRRDEDIPAFLCPAETEYLRYLQGPTASSTACCAEDIVTLLRTLEHKKTLVYKDSWKKRGEVLGVFANIARKYDRLEAVLGEGISPTGDEAVFDTLADLAVYAGKYLTFLAEHEPDSFIAFARQHGAGESITQYLGNGGFGQVMDLLLVRYRSLGNLSDMQATQECLARIHEFFDRLERLLVDREPSHLAHEKSELAGDMALAAIRCMEILGKAAPEDLAAFANAVEAL